MEVRANTRFHEENLEIREINVYKKCVTEIYLTIDLFDYILFNDTFHSSI